MADHDTHDHTGVPGVGGGSTGLLAVSQYAPATRALYTTASATFADVDATNMKVTFTAPASGNVLVRLCAYGDLALANWYYWSLRESTSNLGTPVLVFRGSEGGYRSAAIYLTGLSAGSHTLKWSHATDGTGGQNGRVWAGAGNSSGQESGPAVMEVWAAP